MKSLRALADELNMSVTEVRRILDGAYRSGNLAVAFERTSEGVVYDPAAVRAAVTAHREAQLAQVEVAESAKPIIQAARKVSAKIDAAKARRLLKRAEGQNAKANRRTKKEARQ